MAANSSLALEPGTRPLLKLAVGDGRPVAGGNGAKVSRGKAVNVSRGGERAVKESERLEGVLYSGLCVVITDTSFDGMARLRDRPGGLTSNKSEESGWGLALLLDGRHSLATPLRSREALDGGRADRSREMEKRADKSGGRAPAASLMDCWGCGAGDISHI